MVVSARIDELRKRYDENQRRFFAPLANEYRKAGDVEQAIALCRMHLADAPTNLSGQIVFGQALYEAGTFDESRAAFEAAIGLDPENLIALRHLGDIARIQNDVRRAREWYQRVLDADRRNDEIQALMAELDAIEAQAGSMPSSMSSTPAGQLIDIEPPPPEPVRASAAVSSVASLIGFEPRKTAESDTIAAPAAEPVQEPAPEAAVEHALEIEQTALNEPETVAAPAVQALGFEPTMEDPIDTGAFVVEQIETTAFKPEPTNAVAEGFEPTVSFDIPAAAESTPDTSFGFEINLDMPGTEASGAPESAGEPALLDIDLGAPAVEPAAAAPADAFDTSIDFSGVDLDERLLDAPEDEATPEAVEMSEAAPAEPVVEAQSDETAGAQSSIGNRQSSAPAEEEFVEGWTLAAEPSAPPVAENIPLEQADELDLGEFAPIQPDDTVEIDVISDAVAAPDPLIAEEHALPEAITSSLIFQDTPHGGDAVYHEPVNVEPVSVEPVSVEPVNVEVVNKEPANKEPANEEPANEQPSNEEPPGDEPAIGEVPIDEPASEQPRIDEPATDAPPMEAPPVERPAGRRQTMHDAPELDVAWADLDEGSSADSLDFSETEEPATSAAEPSGEAFATETMAELYVRQGLRFEAIAVYRQLVDARPDDHALRSRLSELQRDDAAPAGATARGFFAGLATRRADSRTPVVPVTAMPDVEPVPPPVDTPHAEGEGTLDALFGAGDIAPSDDSAAQTLASAFTDVPATPPGRPARPASREFSLDEIFKAPPSAPTDSDTEELRSWLNDLSQP